MRALDEDSCWTLLRRADVGRLALVADDGPDVYPVNYLVSGREILFRSAPGSKLADLTARPEVAFEVDGESGGEQWSVVVRGLARRLDRDDEIIASGVLDLATAMPGEKHNFVRITPRVVTGRRFRASDG